MQLTSKAGVAARQRVDDVSSDVYPQLVQSVLVASTASYQPLVASVRLLPLSSSDKHRQTH